MPLRPSRLVIAGLLLLPGCATDIRPAMSPSRTSAASTAPRPDEFAAWVAGLRQEALAKGIAPATFDRAFAGVRPDMKILESEGAQPEFVRPVWDYLDRAVSPERIAEGQRRLAENAALLNQVEAQYGVQPQYLVAIWGMESNYGSNLGGNNVIQALATLAFGSDRKEFFREQLIEALQILQSGDVAPEQMMGSWAGAMGQTQFMPGVYRSFAIDYTNDGRRDIWGSVPDVLASTANYLRSFNWNGGEPWGQEVALPANFDWKLADGETQRPVAEWQSLGVQAAPGTQLTRPEVIGALLLPAGYRGPAFLIYNNFERIKKYNASTSYALAVGKLADQIAGGPPVVAAWPRQEPPLSRTEVVEMQTLLTQLGFDTHGADGAVGPNTRAAIRGFQGSIGQPADGFATQALLQQIRSRAAVS